MSCAACAARVEKAVGSVDGVTQCAVNLLTNSMSVEGQARPEDIIKAVEDAGYGAAMQTKGRASGNGNADADVSSDAETAAMKKRLAASVLFLLILMYFSMGVHMLKFPVPAFMAGDHVMMCLVQLLLCTVIMVINQRFFISGFKSLAHLAPNMDALIAIGSAASFCYSTVMLFVMIHASHTGGDTAAYMDEMYFESAAMILTLITVGKTLEAYSKGKTTDALKSLMKLAPKKANVIRDDKEVTVDIEQVRVGDIFVVRPGESIPTDGVVIEGTSAVNESALTGESIPVDKEAGSSVSCATINLSGFIKCRTTRIGEETTLSRIIAMVSDAAATKAPVAKIADRISAVFVPAVMAIALVTFIVWMVLGQTVGYSLARAISVLVVSCPCALGLATPVAIMVGCGVGARGGILFKTAAALQETGTVKTVCLDKTGTLTTGEPVVTDIYTFDASDEERFVSLVASLENMSEHPLAKAVTAYSKDRGYKTLDAADLKVYPGGGLEGVVDGKHITGGSVDFVSERADLSDKCKDLCAKWASEGKTPVVFVADGAILGIMGIADTIKEDSIQAVKQLKDLGCRIVLLTGDNKRTAESIAALAGVDEVISQVLPDGKADVVSKIKESGKCLMVGDGINDAPALATADTGIAIGAGTDVAIDAADVVLVRSRLTDVAAAIRLSRCTYTNIKQNLFWALIYNVLLIPLACGAYVRFGLTMNPMWGAAAMSCSSLFVVGNALRLNLADIYGAGTPVREEGTGNINTDHKEEDIKMTKTVKIEGMMCAHCEANVKKTLEAMDGITSATVSHEKGEAVIEMSKDVDESAVKAAIEDKDYKFISME